MDDIGKAFSQWFQSTAKNDDLNGLKELALLCGAGLLVALLCLTYGMDLSAGFF